MINKIKMVTSIENIYISPLEICNLNCKYCYTKKIESILTNEQILDFIKRYNTYLNSLDKSLKSITFCGGEVFIIPDFIGLINCLSDQNIFVSIITNGTIDNLDKIKNPNNCQLLVSLDGPKKVHDENRGKGNFDRTIKFLKHGIKLGFHLEIMFLVTPDSYDFVKNFNNYLFKLTGQKIVINFITQKSKPFTENHLLAIENNMESLTKEQILNIKRNYRTIPPKNFGCNQISLQSNGLIYGCCESSNSIGKISDESEKLIKSFFDSLNGCSNCDQKNICGGCSDKDFLCGYKKELKLNSCTDVIKEFK